MAQKVGIHLFDPGNIPSLFFLLIFLKNASNKILETNIEMESYHLIPNLIPMLPTWELVEKNFVAYTMVK